MKKKQTNPNLGIFSKLILYLRTLYFLISSPDTSYTKDKGCLTTGCCAGRHFQNRRTEGALTAAGSPRHSRPLGPGGGGCAGLSREPGPPDCGLNEPSFPNATVLAAQGRASVKGSTLTSGPLAGREGVLKCVARKGISGHFIPQTLRRQKMVRAGVGGGREPERERADSRRRDGHRAGERACGAGTRWEAAWSGRATPAPRGGAERGLQSPSRGPGGPRGRGQGGMLTRSPVGGGVGGAKGSRVGTARPAPGLAPTPSRDPCGLCDASPGRPALAPRPPGTLVRAAGADRAPHRLRARPPAVRHCQAGRRRPLPPPSASSPAPRAPAERREPGARPPRSHSAAAGRRRGP